MSEDILSSIDTEIPSNPHDLDFDGARVQTNSSANATAQINPIHIDGLVSEPQTIDNTPYWHEQFKKPLLPVNRDSQNDFMNIQTQADAQKYKAGNLSKKTTAIGYVITHQNASRNSTAANIMSHPHLFEKKNVSKNSTIVVQKNVTGNHTSNMTKNVTVNATLIQKNVSANKTANKTVNITKNMTGNVSANATKSSLKNVTSQYFNVTISQKNVSANVTMAQRNLTKKTTSHLTLNSTVNVTANKTSNVTANKTASKNASTPVIKQALKQTQSKNEKQVAKAHK